jgi:hypothetical protein
MKLVPFTLPPPRLAKGSIDFFKIVDGLPKKNRRNIR